MKIIHPLVLAGLLVSIFSCADDTGPGGIDGSTKLVDLTLAETEQLCDAWNAEIKDYFASLSITDLCTALGVSKSDTVAECEEEVNRCRPEAAEEIRGSLQNLALNCETSLSSLDTACQVTVSQYDACLSAARVSGRKLIEEVSCENAGEPLPENTPSECAFIQDDDCQ